jgi:hypothetical protein
VRARHLDHLRAQRLEQVDRLAEPGQHAGLIALAASSGTTPMVSPLTSACRAAATTGGTGAFTEVESHGS